MHHDSDDASLALESMHRLLVFVFQPKPPALLLIKYTSFVLIVDRGIDSEGENAASAAAVAITYCGCKDAFVDDSIKSRSSRRRRRRSCRSDGWEDGAVFIIDL